jgi:molybdopterin converting factor small subunit
MADKPRVIVEFFALARFRTGLKELPLRAATVNEAIREVARRCPGLTELRPDFSDRMPFLISLNAGPFLTTWDVELADGDRLLLLSADAGG